MDKGNEMTKYIKFIKDHNQRCNVIDGELQVLDCWTHNGVPFANWITIEATSDSVLCWLGY